MNPFIKQIEYAVRGAIVIRASELEKELEKVKFVCVFVCNKAADDFLAEVEHSCHLLIS